MKAEKTLVLLKTDTVKRGIVGDVLHRFERCGLKIIGIKMVHPEPDFAKDHYMTTDENLAVMGQKTLDDSEKIGVDPIEKFGSSDPIEIGKVIWKWNIEYLTAGPVIAIVLEGMHAVSNTRMLVGHTLPSMAQPGTIRGDFGLDSAVTANSRNRSIYNLIHASGTVEEADREIDLWFKRDELLSYKRVHEDLYSY